VHDILTQALADATGQFQSMLAGVIAYAPTLIAGVVVGAVSFLIARAMRRWGERAVRQAHTHVSVERLIVNAIYAVALALAAVVTLAVLGVNVAGMIAGLGIGGLVIGFALKDIIENLLAGALLLIQQPFNLGDTIQVKDIIGTVTHIELRSTTMNSVEGTRVIIPNRDVYTSVITNYTESVIRRRGVSLGVGYDEKLPAALDALMEAARSVEGVVSDPEPFFAMDDFGDSAITGTLFYYINTENDDFNATHAGVLAALQDVANTKQIDLPYPTSVVINR
jgi:small conductance mechanosensitive channel